MGERIHEVKTYFENDIKTVAQVNVVGLTDKTVDQGSYTCYELMEGSGTYTAFYEDGTTKIVELNRPHQKFQAFRGIPYQAKGFGETGMRVAAISYPPFDSTAVSVVE